MRALTESAGKGALQCSQVGRSSSIGVLGACCYDEKDRFVSLGSFLARVIVDLLKFEPLALWLDNPLVRVRVKANIGLSMIGNDVIQEVFRTCILELVSIARRTNEGIPSHYRNSCF